MIEFAFAGPLTVGLAALANSRFAGGSKAFGIMLSTLGGGFLLGTIIANWFKRTRIGYATFVGALVLGWAARLAGRRAKSFLGVRAARLDCHGSAASCKC